MATKFDPEVKVEPELSSSSEDEKEYVVEKIVDKRYVEGKPQYRLKWKGYWRLSWKPLENLTCPDLIADFERKWAEKKKKIFAAKMKAESTVALEGINGNGGGWNQSAGKGAAGASASKRPRQAEGTATSTSNGDTSRSRPSAVREDEWTAFDKGLEPERIIAATDSPGELYFLVQWKNIKETDLVPARVANLMCPQLVIQFYEDHLVLVDPRHPTVPLGVRNEN